MQFFRGGPMGMGWIGKGVILASLALLGGCSATSLRCGVDGESSFVDLVNLPQDISAQSRYFAELCGFAYEEDDEPLASLNIVDPSVLARN